MPKDLFNQYKQTLIWYLLFAANTTAGVLNVSSAIDDNHKLLNTLLASLAFTAATGSAYTTYKMFKKEKDSQKQR